ncbi:MAG: cation:proton antiporter [Acidobacteria bacterium]|nr:cation:proton antiporter [Acidobacteriota bacterium]
MREPHQILIVIGLLLLLGLVTHVVGRRTALPRVTLLLLFGLLIGPSGFGLLPDAQEHWFPVVADMALVMVGFLLGERLTVRRLRSIGKPVLWISLAVVGTTALVMAFGLAALGLPLTLCLSLAGVATATDPAATMAVAKEINAQGPFTDTLLAIVAVDDAWGLMLFSVLLGTAEVLAGGVVGGGALLHVLWEIGGAIGLGALLGLPMAYLTGRIEKGEPTLGEALGVVFLCGGVAIWIGVSFLLAAITLGSVVASLAKHHKRPFHAIEGIEMPFLVMFFVLAGASLYLRSLAAVGVAGIGYVLLRTGSRVLGGWLGSRLAGAPVSTRRWIGWALMPQAGVAVGMSLLAAQRFPEIADTILPVVVGSTVLFEVLGPIATRIALRAVGEAQLEPLAP